MFHVDFLGCYFAPLLHQLQTDSSSENGHRIGVRLGDTIVETFGQQSLVHCDGVATKEKEKAHLERQEKRKKAKEKMETAVRSMKVRSLAGKWTSRAAVETIRKCLKRVFVVPAATMEAVLDGLASKVTLCQCTFEADLCIAGLASDQKDTVVSGDSDLLCFEGIMTVLRPLLNHQGYGLYSKEATLKALGLPTEKHLALLATVSNNDFSKNIEGLGLARNTDIIVRIPSSTSAAMLDHYCAVAATKVSAEIAPSHFQKREHVFLDKRATPLEALPARHDSDFTDGAAELERRMHMRVAMKAQRARSLMTTPPFYVAHKSHPNQFRPVFRSKKSIFAGRKYSDVTKSKLHDHQLPLRIPRRRPRPPAAKKPMSRRLGKGRRRPNRRRKSDNSAQLWWTISSYGADSRPRLSRLDR